MDISITGSSGYINVVCVACGYEYARFIFEEAYGYFFSCACGPLPIRRDGNFYYAECLRHINWGQISVLRVRDFIDRCERSLE